MRRWLPRRLVAGLVASTTVAVVLTSCSVPSHGLTGVMINRSGQLTAVLGWCPGHAPDGVVLYTDTNTGTDRESSIRIGRWAADHKLTGTYFELPLTRPPAGWRSDPPGLRTLDPQRTYVMFGGTNDNSSSTAHVRFTVAGLRSQARGTVLVWSGRSEENDGDVYLPVAPAEFQRRVRDRYRC